MSDRFCQISDGSLVISLHYKLCMKFVAFLLLNIDMLCSKSVSAGLAIWIKILIKSKINYI